MKKLLSIALAGLLIGALCAGCRVADGGEQGREPPASNAALSGSQEAAKQETEVQNGKFGYTIKLPEKLMKNCSYRLSGDGREIYIELKGGQDMVLAVMTVPDSEYQEQLGTKFLASNGQYTVYLQFPTCGTLNRESDRELWNEMVKEGQGIEQSAITGWGETEGA